MHQLGGRIVSRTQITSSFSIFSYIYRFLKNVDRAIHDQWLLVSQGKDLLNIYDFLNIDDSLNIDDIDDFLEECLVQAEIVRSPPCLSVLVHVHVNISVLILVIHGSHYNPGCQSHIMPVTKTLTSDHPWLSMDCQYESNPCQSIHVSYCNHDNPWLSMHRQYESNPCQSIYACHCNHDSPWLSRDCQYESNLVRVSMSVIVTMTIHEIFIRVSKYVTVILVVQSATMVIVDNC